MEEMSLEEAKAQNAVGVFESKYGETVKVYTVEGIFQGDMRRSACRQYRGTRAL